MEFEEIKKEETVISEFTTIEPEIPKEEPNPSTVNAQTIQIPEWDLVPPFDAVDRSEM